MAYVELSKTDDYELTHEDQDVRGWEVRDAAGKPIGRVDDMIIDTEMERVDRIRLDNGTTVLAKDIFIGENTVYLDEVVGNTDVRPVMKVHDDYGRVRRVRVL